MAELEDKVDGGSLIEQRQSGFIVVPSEKGDDTPDENINGGPLDITSVISNLDPKSQVSPFPNAYYGQLTYNTADNSFYFWSKDNKWQKLIN